MALASELVSCTVFVIGDRFCLMACAAIYEFSLKSKCSVKSGFVCFPYTTRMSCYFHHLLTKAGQLAISKKIFSILSSHTLWNLPIEEFLLHPVCWESILSPHFQKSNKVRCCQLHIYNHCVDGSPKLSSFKEKRILLSISNQFN